MHRHLRFFFVWALVAGYLPCFAAGSPELLNRDSLRPVFTLTLPQGAAQAGADWLSLHLLRDGDTAALSVASEYITRGRTLQMTPFTELDFGADYILRWRTVDGFKSGSYSTPEKNVSAPAKLLARYPQTDSVPENLLMLQFRFDAPMRPDPDVWTRFRIRADTPGATDIPYAWRQRCYWLDSDRVLQLMIHPGRVKSGIDYGGPLLFAGRSYRIDIDSGLVDLKGNTLGVQAEQRLVAGIEDHRIPAVTGVPKLLRAGSADPVRLSFSERMDYSGLLDGIRLLDAGGRDVDAGLELSPDGRTCELRPVERWQTGVYRLELSAEIRDLGANTLRRPFEVRSVKEAKNDVVPVVFRLLAR